MTHEETIDILDALIITLNGQSAFRTNLTRTKNYIIEELHKTSVSSATINAILGIKVKEYTPNSLAQYCLDLQGFEKRDIEEYKSTLLSIINVLTEERERLKKILNEEVQQQAFEEQKKGNEIQYKAYICSIVAIVIAVASLIVAICK